MRDNTGELQNRYVLKGVPMEKILIIDDSLVQADVLKSILKDNYDVTAVHTAEAGLQHAASEIGRAHV